MGRRRICFCVPNLSGGGAERVAMQIAGALDPTRFDVTLLVQERVGAWAGHLPEGLRVRFIHEGTYRRSQLPSSLLATIREARLHDVMVGANEGRASMAALLAAKLTGRRAVAWIHVSWREFGPLVSWRQRVALRLYAAFDVIVAVSQGAALDLAALSPGRRLPLQVIHNPVDLDAVQAATARPIEPEHEALFDRPVVLSAGRLSQQKGQSALIEAHARLIERGVDHRLVILGEGPLRDDLLAQARDLGVAGTVTLPGFVHDPQRYMARAAVFALSSRFEGFSLVLAEALAAGAPVVSFDCPHGPAEVLDHGRAGILVPPGDVEGLADAIGLVLADPARAMAMREVGRLRAQAFDLPTIAARWEALFMA